VLRSFLHGSQRFFRVPYGVEPTVWQPLSLATTDGAAIRMPVDQLRPVNLLHNLRDFREFHGHSTPSGHVVLTSELGPNEQAPLKTVAVLLQSSAALSPRITVWHHQPTRLIPESSCRKSPSKFLDCSPFPDRSTISRSLQAFGTGNATPGRFCPNGD
jgi:hypothetical protein